MIMFGSFLPSLGWLAPPKFTRAWEPTLLWNHFTSNGQYDRFTRRVGEFFTIPKRPPDTNIRTDQCYNQLAMRRARSISLIVLCLLAGIQLQAASSKKALEKRVARFSASLTSLAVSGELKLFPCR